MNSSPPSQTGPAVLPHPAFQSVAAGGLAQALGARRTEAPHQPRRVALRSPVSGRPTGNRRRTPQRGSLAPRRTASRHYRGPGGSGARRQPPPRSYVPSLHDHYSLLRYYGRSDPDRPVRRRQPWFPDSRHLNCQTFHLQPSAVLRQPRSTRSALTALFCSGFDVSLAGSPAPPTESSSRCPPKGTGLRTVRSLPVALHPGMSPRCSYFPLLALQCRPGQGLSPCCSGALSGALGQPFQSASERGFRVPCSVPRLGFPAEETGDKKVVRHWRTRISALRRIPYSFAATNAATSPSIVCFFASTVGSRLSAWRVFVVSGPMDASLRAGNFFTSSGRL